MAEWETAIEKQMATWAFYTSDPGRRYLRGFRQAQYSEWPENDPLLRSLEHNVASTLWNADPVFVSPDMMTLLERAWPEFDVSEPLAEEDVFIPFGFVYLPRPVIINDRNGRPTRHRAVAWLPARRSEDGAPASFVTTWAETDDVRADETAFPRLTVDGEEYDHDRMARWFGNALVLNYASPMMYGQTVEDMLTNSAAKEERLRADFSERDWQDNVIPATTNLLRFLQSLWRLMGQRVAVGLPQRPSRAHRRRAERERYPEKYVTVITLRRPKQQASGEAQPREWTHRWLVSGHWRWQPYPKENTRKQIWISPYIKGPDDAPLRIRGARVFKWAR